MKLHGFARAGRTEQQQAAFGMLEHLAELPGSLLGRHFDETAAVALPDAVQRSVEVQVHREPVGHFLAVAALVALGQPVAHGLYGGVVDGYAGGFRLRCCREFRGQM